MKTIRVNLERLPSWIIRDENGKLLINPNVQINATDVSASVAMARLIKKDFSMFSKDELEAEVEKSHMVLTYYCAILEDRRVKEAMI